MIPGYEWVFVICYVSAGYGVLLLLHEAYLVIGERRARRGVKRIPSGRPRPPRQVF
jgi:hypothetical protein